MTDKTRRYHAPGREAQAQRTRARILTAARDLFTEEGFGTTIGKIATSAGVSRATVELIFGTKAAVLDAVVDVALAGDDQPVPILERAWVRELETVPVVEFLRAVAAAFAAGAGRVSPLLRALDEGSHRSAELTALADRLRRQRLAMADWMVSAVTSRQALAADLTVEEAIDTVLVLIDPLLQRRLLIEECWTVERLAGWLDRALRRLLLEPDVPLKASDGVRAVDP